MSFGDQNSVTFAAPQTVSPPVLATEPFHAPVPVQRHEVAEPFRFSLSEDRFKQQLETKTNILQFIKQCLTKDVHYGLIPGTGKDTLYLAGAQQICSLISVRPHYSITPFHLSNNHREFVVKCELLFIGTDVIASEGFGSCGTMEVKYRYRNAPAEDTGAPVPKDYWGLKKGNKIDQAQELLGGKGFMAKKNAAGEWTIHKATGEKEDNADIADLYNTVLKMAMKRAYVGATLSLSGGWSEHFTQDLEDMKHLLGVIEGEVIDDKKPSASASESEKPEQSASSESAKGKEKSEKPDKNTEAVSKAVEALLDDSAMRGTPKEGSTRDWLVAQWRKTANEAGFENADPKGIPAKKLAELIDSYSRRILDIFAKNRQAQKDMEGPPADSQGVREAQLRQLMVTKYWTDDDDLQEIMNYLDERRAAAAQSLFIEEPDVNKISAESFQELMQAWEHMVDKDPRRLPSPTTMKK